MTGRPPTLNKGLGKSSDKGRKRVPIPGSSPGCACQLMRVNVGCETRRDERRQNSDDAPLEGPPIRMTALAEGVAMTRLGLAEYRERERGNPLDRPLLVLSPMIMTRCHIFFFRNLCLNLGNAHTEKCKRYERERNKRKATRLRRRRRPRAHEVGRCTTTLPSNPACLIVSPKSVNSRVGNVVCST